MKKTVSSFILLLTLGFAWIFIGNLRIVKAESADYVKYSSGVTVYSPLNITYNSCFLSLNITFDAGLGIENYLNYSIDGQQQIPISLVRKDPELHIVNELIGYLILPELSEGSHYLTINVLCELKDYHGVNPPGAPFTPTSPGSSDYIATWTHTIYFSIDTSIPEFPLWIILTLLLVATVVVTVARNKLVRKGLE